MSTQELIGLVEPYQGWIRSGIFLCCFVLAVGLPLLTLEYRHIFILHRKPHTFEELTFPVIKGATWVGAVVLPMLGLVLLVVEKPEIGIASMLLALGMWYALSVKSLLITVPAILITGYYVIDRWPQSRALTIAMISGMILVVGMIQFKDVIRRNPKYSLAVVITTVCLAVLSYALIAIPQVRMWLIVSFLSIIVILLFIAEWRYVMKRKDVDYPKATATTAISMTVLLMLCVVGWWVSGNIPYDDWPLWYKQLDYVIFLCVAAIVVPWFVIGWRLYSYRTSYP